MSSTRTRQIVDDRDGRLVVVRQAVRHERTAGPCPRRKQVRRGGEELLSVLSREQGGWPSDRHDEVRCGASKNEHWM